MFVERKEEEEGGGGKLWAESGLDGDAFPHLPILLFRVPPLAQATRKCARFAQNVRICANVLCKILPCKLSNGAKSFRAKTTQKMREKGVKMSIVRNFVWLGPLTVFSRPSKAQILMKKKDLCCCLKIFLLL